MLRRAVRLAIRLGILAGVLFAIAKVLDARRHLEPEPAPLPVRDWPPLQPQPAAAPAVAWIEPSGDVCPTSHPVKAKLSSKIFHLPGMLNYDRTKPDRCYVDAASAEAEGLRAAKR